MKFLLLKYYSIKNLVVNVFEGHERSVKLKKNIVLSILFKLFSAISSFLLVPITLNYLEPVKYGIWLTLSSLIAWFSLFDVGLGHGLRNKFAEAITKNEKELAKKYVSTTYAVILIIISCIFFIFIFGNQFLDWSKILNAPHSYNQELTQLALIVFTFFSLRFVFTIILSVLMADQKLGAVGFIDFAGNFLSLIVTWALTKTTANSLILIGLGLSVTSVIAPLIATFWYFKNNYNFYSPSLKFVDFTYLKHLMPLSFDFFLLSISTLILYFSQNIIITQLLGPEKVAVFNIAYKYFFYIILLQTLILNPVWSASIEAFNLGELNWIKQIIIKLLKIWVGLVGLIIIMVIFADQFYLFWIRGKIDIPLEVTISMGLYVIIFSWYSNFAYIINGIGKIKLQLYIIASVSMFNIFLSIFLIKFMGLGVEGVILSSIICTLPGAVFIPLQLKKILSNKAEGIWIR